MNDKFYTLPMEKQHTILNAAMHVFSKYEYKKCSTEEIAKKAGISKALLFHYFEGKKDLYLYLYQYALDFFVREMSKTHDYNETDYFKILVNAQMNKMDILRVHPDLMQFLVKFYLEENPEVYDEKNKEFAAILSESSKRFMDRADTSKFKEGIDAEKILNIIVWMADGYMRSRTEKDLENTDRINEEYLEYIEIMRRQCYKEEYLV